MVVNIAVSPFVGYTFYYTGVPVQVISMYRFRAISMLVALAIFGVISCAEEAPDTRQQATTSDTFFAVTGDVTVSVDDATATMIKVRDRIPVLRIVSSSASIRKLGTSYAVSLFFSDDFSPKPGKYPIEFSYLKKQDTLGGSFNQRGGTFSHDTKGTAEFVEFAERVKVIFEFQTFDKSEGKADRRTVTVKGEAVCDCPHADIF